MTNTQREINYRPALSEQLQSVLTQTLSAYRRNFQTMAYLLTGTLLEAQNPGAKDFFCQIAKLFASDDWSAMDEFELNYKDDMLRLYRLRPFTDVEALTFWYQAIEKNIDELEKEVDTTDLTKLEKYYVTHFFKELKSPLRNPNLKVQPNRQKAYYEEHPTELRTSINQSYDYIEKDLQKVIDMFAISDQL